MSRDLYKKFKDPQFIAKLKQRDHGCIEDVVRAYTDHLLKASLGLGFSQQEASELVQNVWGTFFDVLPNFKANSHVRTFLFGILYNKSKEYRREKAKLNQHEVIDEIMQERFNENGTWKNHIMDPELFLATCQSLDIIEKCMNALPLHQKMAFRLKEIDGQKTSEICKILDITSTNLGVLLYRAKNRLRECIEKKIEV